MHGPRGPIVSSTGSSGPSGRKRSASAGSGRSCRTWRTRWQGITRWTTHTAGYELAALRPIGLELRPLVEIAYARIGKVGGGLFDVEDLYGRNRIWSVSVGVRIGAGTPMQRMGRYGAADDTMATITRE